MRLFVCYVPGLDARRIDADAAPALHALRAGCPSVTLSTLPSTELLPTLLTGVYPHRHGVWQVRLRPPRTGGAARGLFERLPDAVTTTLQGVRQSMDASFDLTTVPPRRRRSFEQIRFKYTRRERSDRTLMRFGECETILGLMNECSRYAFARRFDRAHALLPSFLPEPGDREALRFFELYALDLFQHWHLDRPDRMRWALSRTDAFVGEVIERCRELGITFMLVVDHGQELVTGTIPLRSVIERAPVPASEYTYFLEVAQCRLWFHTKRARNVLTERIGALERVTLRHRRELAPVHLHFDDDRWGEVYVFADPGQIFFPHDFYRPIANLYLGLADRYQRPRVRNPRHRGNHGYLPEHPSEKGFVTLADAAYMPLSREAELIDVAPTILELMGRPKLDHMEGGSLFAPC